MARPISAFARRKAAQTGLGEVSAPLEASIVVAAQDNDEASPPPRKRRKKRDSSKSVVVISAIPEIPPVDQDGVNRENGGDLERSDPSDYEWELETEISKSEDEALCTVTAQRLSTFSTKKSTVLSDTDSEWRVRLHQQDDLAIVGQYDLWVRSGAISILGAVIHASSKIHRIYAPSTHSIPSIKGVPNPYGTGNPPCEVSIISCGSRIRMLQQVAPKFGRIWNGEEQAPSTTRSFVNVQNSADDPYKRPLRLLEPPSDWSILVSKLIARDHAAVMVCGPKGAGKSTFCRMLANALLSNMPVQQRNIKTTQSSNYVAFLDLDPGQPEYSPPGEISLHMIKAYNFGPPFVHPSSQSSNECVSAHHFGYISPKEDPYHYHRCAIDLFSHYKSMSANNPLCPLIVNSSGWIQGSGLELLDNFVRDLDLTDVIYMSTTGPKEVVNVLCEATAMANVHLHELTSHASEVATRTAADMRMMQTLSYFHLDEPDGDNLRWNPAPIASLPPVVVRYAGEKPDIFATMILGDEQSPDFLETILDGSIVGVVVIDEDLALALDGNKVVHNIASLEVDPDVDDGTSRGNTISDPRDSTQSKDTVQHEPEKLPPTLLRNANGIPYLTSQHHTTPPLPPSHSHSLGQALIRAIDTATKTFHLSTPIPSPIIQNILSEGRQKIVLVRGKLDTPTWAYAEQFEFERARRRRLESEGGLEGGYEADDVRVWAGRQPWACVGGGGRSGSGRVRRVRRDLRYKGQSGGVV